MSNENETIVETLPGALINGSWREGSGGTFDVYSPHSRALLHRVSRCNPDDVALAISAEEDASFFFFLFCANEPSSSFEVKGITSSFPCSLSPPLLCPSSPDSFFSKQKSATWHTSEDEGGTKSGNKETPRPRDPRFFAPQIFGANDSERGHAASARTQEKTRRRRRDEGGPDWVKGEGGRARHAHTWQKKGRRRSEEKARQTDTLYG